MGVGNCIIAIANFGVIRVKAEQVVHGMSVVSFVGGEGTSRRARAYYPSKRTSGSFDLDLVFTHYAGYRRVCGWLERYTEWASNPRAESCTPARVLIPSRNFDKVGMLEQGITYGDQVGMIAWRITLEFCGSRAPMEMNKANMSTFKLPKVEDPALPYLYPGGVRASLTEDGFGNIYDISAEELLLENVGEGAGAAGAGVGPPDDDPWVPWNPFGWD